MDGAQTFSPVGSERGLEECVVFYGYLVVFGGACRFLGSFVRVRPRIQTINYKNILVSCVYNKSTLWATSFCKTGACFCVERGAVFFPKRRLGEKGCVLGRGLSGSVVLESSCGLDCSLLEIDIGTRGCLVFFANLPLFRVSPSARA